MKVYKFRSNEDKHLKDIIEREEFYFNDWESMNDPLEGFFTYYLKDHTSTEIEQIKTDKNKYRICCFSGNFKEILQWSHYANSHKGICFEIEIDTNIEYKKIIYRKNLQSLLLRENGKSKDPIKLLSKKLINWKYEDEIRFFYKDEEFAIPKRKGINKKIGKITRIITGISFEDENEEIQNLAKKKNIPIEKAKFNLEKSEIVIPNM